MTTRDCFSTCRLRPLTWAAESAQRVRPHLDDLTQNRHACPSVCLGDTHCTHARTPCELRHAVKRASRYGSRSQLRGSGRQLRNGWRRLRPSSGTAQGAQGPALRPQGTDAAFRKPQEHLSPGRAFQPPEDGQQAEGTERDSRSQRKAARRGTEPGPGDSGPFPGGQRPSQWRNGKADCDAKMLDTGQAGALLVELASSRNLGGGGQAPDDRASFSPELPAVPGGLVGQGGKGSSLGQSQCLDVTDGHGARAACAQTLAFPTWRWAVPQREAGTPTGGARSREGGGTRPATRKLQLSHQQTRKARARCL